MRIHQFVTTIFCLGLASSCLAQATDSKSPNPPAVEINAAPIKDLAAELFRMCQSGQPDLPSDNSSVMASFKVDPDGSMPIDSIRIVRSSGSKAIDKKAIEILWRMSESHAFVPLSLLSSNTIEFKGDKSAIKLAMAGFASTAEEAQTKATQLSFLLKTVAVLQKAKAKNPLVSELFSHLVIKSDGNRIDAEITIPCDRAAELLRQLSAKPGAN